jgi:Circularly permutated YpsA SLOG family
MPVLRKIISGGQTGADRAGLDFAIEVGLAHGGYVPKGRKAEDGRINERYTLVELSSSSYPERTKRNVRESDGTVILSLNDKLSGGSALTLSYAQHAKKPVLHLHNSETGRDPLPRQVRQLKEFIESNAIEVLNVAGPRESKEPGVYRFALQLLRQYWQDREDRL